MYCDVRVTKKRCISVLFVMLVLSFTINIFAFGVGFVGFQADSEALAKNSIQAIYNGDTIYKFGLLAKEDDNRLLEYKSQAGLQGMCYKFMAQYVRIFLPQNFFVKGTKVLLTIFLAIVLMAIVMLLAKKYNKLLAICFYTTFLTSPWIINFGRNLYWVEFTWFLPILIGLALSINSANKKRYIYLYLGMFIAILGKCLCGYEYISSIMLASIMFLVTDMFTYIIVKDFSKVKKIFGTILIVSVIELFAFAVAILIHANMFDGNFANGIASIGSDVLRRTYGSPSAFDQIYYDSLNASWFSVVKMYFNFSTPIVLGINGNYFKLFCFLAGLVFVFNAKKGAGIEVSENFLWVWSLLIPLSWFILAKGHSYLHTHINFVLWYFGFVQVSLYLILKFLIKNRKLFSGQRLEKLFENSKEL